MNDIVKKIIPVNEQPIITTSLEMHHHEYIHAATSQNTRKSYQSDLRHYIAFGGLLPATSVDIVRYLHHYAKELNTRTLSRRLVAISHWHKLQGFPDPTSQPLVKKTMIGIQHVHGKPKRKARAVSLEYLNTMVEHLLNDGSLYALRNAALLLIGFYGAFRRSELIRLKVEQLQFQEDGLSILIPRSKGDQTGEGETCGIPYHQHGFCPVVILKRWLEDAHIDAGNVFRHMKSNNIITEKPLAAQSVSLILKQVAKDASIPEAEAFSSHSLRRGFATVASRNGVNFISIMRHGRWKHEATVIGYVEEGRLFEDNPLHKIYAQQADFKKDGCE